ncbi:hypothetical protein RN001_009599 [Aquatica leii]|uniref:Glutathione S-transferase n=1 Tax=Aquatica leii TaxID=1421715 RepID=A0AAN7SMZ2_9COLE|nr:hypothetical protein RN001_009599 [Aquatica leii]
MISRYISRLILSETPILYYSQFSPPARAAYMVAKTLGLRLDLKNVNIFTKEYVTPDLMQANPQHTIPTLIDGNYHLWDSHAIAGYLVGQYGQDDSLYPKNPKKRAHVDQKLHFDTEQLFPKIYDTIYPILFRGRTEIPLIARKRVERTYDLLERFLSRSPWLAGTDLTIADICCISSISTLDYVIPIRKKYTPHLYDYMQRCSHLPHYEETIQRGVDQLGSKIQEHLITSYIKHYSIYKNLD